MSQCLKIIACDYRNSFHACMRKAFCNLSIFVNFLKNCVDEDNNNCKTFCIRHNQVT